MFTSRRRREALTLGPEVLVNGDFSSGQPPWVVAGADATHIATFAGGTCRYQSDTTSPSLFVTQVGVLTVGKTYRISVVCSAWTSGTLVARLGSTATPNITGVGTFTYILQCTGTQDAVLTRSSINVDITIDSVSIKQVGP